MTLESNEHRHRQKMLKCLNLQYIIEVAKAVSYTQNFILSGLSCPVSVLYTIIILLNNFSSESTWPIFTKFHVTPAVKMGVRVCSSGHAPLTVMPVYE